MNEGRGKRPTEPPPVRSADPASSSKPSAKPMSTHPIGTPRGTSTNSAILAVAAWLAARGIYPPMGRHWHIDIILGITDAPTSFGFVGTRFELRFSSEEWGFSFCHDNRVSNIRVIDVPFVRDRDDHQLLAQTPPLKNINALVRQLEQRHGIFFQRRRATVRTDLTGVEPIVVSWAASL